MPASPHGSVNLPAVASTAFKPALVDRDADYDVPRLWRDRDVYGVPKTIARALTEGEQAVVERRRNDLLIGCAPHAASETDRVVKAISRMLGGIRSLRHDDEETAVAGLDGLRHVLASFPLWAIETGCHTIHCGEAVFDGRKQDRRWAPNDSEVYVVVKEIVEPYRKILDAANALLAAPVREFENAGRA